MKKYLYMHCSMAGSYYVPCKTIKEIDSERVKIKFYDFIIKRNVTVIVGVSQLKEIAKRPIIKMRKQK